MLKFIETAEIIKKVLQEEPLPGIPAMLEMAPVSRRAYEHNHSESAILASVLFLIYPKSDEIYFPIIVRPSKNIQDKHRGQLSMPGGKLESCDFDQWACAVRETTEELGIDGTKIEYLGELSPLWIPISNFMVYPFAGLYPEKPVFSIQQDEVADVIELPLKKLLDKTSKKIGSIPLPTGMILEGVPYFQIEDKIIWGATAMMLNEIVSLLESKSLF